MNLNSIKDKVQESKLFNSVFRNPFIIVVGFLVIAISLVNFSSSQSAECPAILTYDEISESISIHYCKVDNESYQLEALDNSGVIQAKQVQYTVNGTISVLPWGDSKITVNSLPDYVLLNLIFSDACFKNNSTDVSFPIDLSSVRDCGMVSIIGKPVDVVENSIISEELGLTEKEVDDDPIVVSDDDAVPVKQLATVNPEKVKALPERLEVIRQEDEQKNTKPLQATTVRELKETETVIKTTKLLRPRQSEEKVSQHASVVDVKLENRITQDKEPHSPVPRLEVTEHAGNSIRLDIEENTVADHSAEVYSAPIESPASMAISNAAITKPITNVNLFDTKTIGIKKSCIRTASRIESQTDLFTMSIKPHKTITLYDVYCYAAENSEMTITLSQLGNIVTSFSVSLNKGENQIGLTALGLLEANEAYLIEYKTKNRGDVNLFSACKSVATHSNEIVIRYLDDHNAFYGLTYEIEIQ